MSLVMYRGTTISSSGLLRGTGNLRSTSYCGNHTVAGSSSVGTSSSHNAPRTSKQPHSTVRRPLPNGSGPLPDRPKVDTGKVKYVASGSSTTSTRDRSSFNHVSHKKSAIDSPTNRRKASNDSGYVSGGRDSTFPNFRYGDLRSSGRKSKSLSNLSIKDETNNLSTAPPIRSRTDSSAPRVAGQKTGSFYAQESRERDRLNSKQTYNTSNGSNIYQSTTHSDYKDPKEDKSSLTKIGRSYASDKDLSNGYPGKSSYGLIDVEKTRRETITALPGSDLKCSRKSSLSSSNSSPSVSKYANDKLNAVHVQAEVIEAYY